MLNLKVNPVEIDIHIQLLQQFLYTQLKNTWGLTDQTFDSYGRVYRSLTTEGYVPEVFISGTATEYKEAFFDDTLNSAVSFFLAGDSVKYDHGNSNAKVSVIFRVNVSKIKPLIAHRADAEIRLDVEKLIELRKYGFEMQEVVTGYKNVFNEFDGWTKQQQPVFGDMQPFHVFRINMNLLYDLNDCK